MFETSMTVVGWMTSDVTQRTLPSGDKMCTFRVVARERRFNRETQEWGDGDRLFIQVKCWRRLAEGVCGSLFKGDPVVVTGRVYLNEYEINGEPRSMIELEAQAVGPNLALCSAMLSRPNRDSVLSAEPMAPTVLAA